MTEPRPATRKPGAAPVFWASVLLFAALFALLTWRFSIGKDPSLSGATASRPVQVRKVIKRRVVTTIVPTPGANTVTSGPATSSSYSSGAITTGAS
ncbi:MAG TPA: hypothetical protein VF731_04735 [Solirubrobacterales bacterium]